MKTMQKGFTLIELMIVIAILGILLAIAIPAYSDYTVRAKVSEGMNLATSPKMSVSEYRLSNSSFPTNNNLAGLPQTITTSLVTSMLVSGTGNITVTYSSLTPEISGNTLIMVPTFAGNTVQWTCDTGTVLSRYRPASCR